MINKKETIKMVKDINKLADKLIKQTEKKKVPIMKIGIFVTLLSLLTYSVSSNAACNYKTDAWGNVKYNCNSGSNGTLRTDAWGNIKDTGTGLTYKKDAWGNTRSSDGTTYKTDAWGNTRGSDGTTARKDAWGNTTITNSNGSRTICRKDSWGNTSCK
jgi:hypothetical protein